MKILFLKLCFVLLLVSCVQEKIGNYTEIKTAGVNSSTDEFSVIGGFDRGEFLLGAPSVNITAQVHNSSTYPYKNLMLNVDNLSTAGVKFAPDSKGMSYAPGLGGTCKSDLAPGKSCTFILTFTPTNMGELYQDLSLTYMNLVHPVQRKAKLTFIVGDYSNLVEINQKIKHSFGTIERMEADKYYEKVVELENVGGLSARNLTFGLTNLADGAYSIVKNTCPQTLAAKAKCQITVRVQSQNYLPGDASKTYTSDLIIDYFKNPVTDPNIEKGRFGFNFTTFSTKVEGILAVSGVSGVAFPKLVHGNKSELEFKLKNSGIKDLILRKIIVYDNTGVAKAACGRSDDLGKIQCLDLSLNPLPLLTFPFSFKDVNNCLANAALGDYARDPLNSSLFTSYTPKIIAPPTDTTPSEICTFKITYHSSIANTVDTNFNNWVVGFEYDNTFKNTKELVTTTFATGARITVTQALGLKGSNLIFSKYTINTTNTNNPSSPYSFDIGRVSLQQSNSTYFDTIKLAFSNSVTSSPVKIKSVVTESDSGTFTFNNSARTINDYYYGAYLSTNCKISVAYTTNICEIVYKFTPKDPQSQSKLLGPNALALGKTAREFIITYNNGCSINDDGTACADKTIKVNFAANLVVRGSLQYNTVKSGGGTGALPLKYNVGTTFVGSLPLVGQLTWYYLWLENIGTGTIPYLKTVTGASFKTSNSSAPFPFTIVADNSGLGAGEVDCYDFLRGTPDLNDDLPTALTTPISMPPGTKCRLKVESMRYPNEVITNYGNTEWNREFYVNRVSNREYIYQASLQHNAMFEYYDGDLTPPAPTSGFVTNFGEKTTILGGTNGRFLFKSQFAYFGKVVPTKPQPVVSAILYRPGFTLPAIAKHSNSQMPAIAGSTISPHVFNLQTGLTPLSYSVSAGAIAVPQPAAGYSALPSVGTREAFAHFNAAYPFTNYTGFDYVFHAGSFPAETGQEFVGSFFLDNTAYGAISSLSASLLGAEAVKPAGAVNTITLGTTLPTSLASLTGSASVIFKIKPDSALDVGLHEATYQVSFNNPNAQVLRIKILFDVVPKTNKAIAIEATDYECNFSTDPNCLTPISSKAPVDITSQFLINKLPNTGTKMTAVAGSPVGALKKLRITNTGTTPITDIKIFFKDSVGNPKATYTNPLGFSISPVPVALAAVPAANQYQCPQDVSGTLAVGNTCEIKIKYSPVSANNFPQVLTIGYRQVDGVGNKGAYINQNLDLMFVGDNQANLVIDGTTTKSFSYMAQNISSYPIKFGNFIQSNHPVLTTYPKTTIDSTGLITSPPLELFNQRSEKASLLKQYEEYATANALPLTPPVQLWTRIYKSSNDEIAIEANQGCFYGNDYANPAVDANKKGFYSNDYNTSTGCRLKLVYEIGIERKGNIVSSNTIIPLKYYSTRRDTVKTVYLHIEGFVEPYKSLNATDAINDVYVNDLGDVQFSWDNFLDETAAYGDINRYRVYYSKFGSDLVKFHEASKPVTLMSIDTAGTSDPTVTLNNLELGIVYYFQVVAIRRTNPLDPATEYISMPNSFYRKKILIPPAGYAYDYETGNLIQKSLYPLNGEAVLKSDALSACMATTVVLKDEAITMNKALGLINNDIYENIILSEKADLIGNGGDPSNLLYSNHNFMETTTWINDVADVSALFSPYDCSLPVAFSADNTSGYVKSCDNNNPAILCCDMHVLNQIKGQPLPSALTVETLYTNLSGIKAQYRCFVKLNL